ncbi:heavy metal-associated isoprenylated plant protein 16-like [Syzygium oleosum]|uniref:heavy metal-associated isoprenylated plant protein 16-like n=1 Tax=Syzygium oleosum TaxID=219896 RepID=UPI0011D2008C|nr:heavy metal-associated isoprenylated plant protein 16-like [Syzygium oleosum]
MDCEKARSKAMKIAADANGVTSVAVEIDKNQLVVTGEGVDIACLTRALRKKVAPASIVSVAEVKPEDKKKKEDKKKEEEEKKKLLCCTQKQFCCTQKQLCCAQYPACSVVYDQDPPLCTIM